MSTLLSVAQVIATAEDAWIEPGVRATVENVEQVAIKKGARAGSFFHKATLSDGPGTPTVTMSVFTAPKFKPGDTVEVSGKGIKRKSFNGAPEIGVGKDSVINVSMGAPRVLAAAQSAKAAHPPTNGSVGPIHGASVGAAVKLAFDAHIAALDADVISSTLKLPAFWKEVWETASDVIRVHQALEHGQLAAHVKERMHAPAPPPPPTRQTQESDFDAEEPPPF